MGDLAPPATMVAHLGDCMAMASAVHGLTALAMAHGHRYSNQLVPGPWPARARDALLEIMQGGCLQRVPRKHSKYAGPLPRAHAPNSLKICRAAPKSARPNAGGSYWASRRAIQLSRPTRPARPKTQQPAFHGVSIIPLPGWGSPPNPLLWSARNSSSSHASGDALSRVSPTTPIVASGIPLCQQRPLDGIEYGDLSPGCDDGARLPRVRLGCRGLCLAAAHSLLSLLGSIGMRGPRPRGSPPPLVPSRARVGWDAGASASQQISTRTPTPALTSVAGLLPPRRASTQINVPSMNANWPGPLRRKPAQSTFHP